MGDKTGFFTNFLANIRRNRLLKQIVYCIESGKINYESPFPDNLKGKEGAEELTLKALRSGISAEDILSDGLLAGIGKAGLLFSQYKIFVPQLLMSAKAVNASIEHLRPYLVKDSSEARGTLIIGTVDGDFHDIGKNIVAIMAEAVGYKVIDLGVNVKPDKFVAEAEKNPHAIVGISALLTTTMQNMDKTVKAIKEKVPGCIVMIGGAPVSEAFCQKIGADFYSPDFHGAIEYLEASAN